MSTTLAVAIFTYCLLAFLAGVALVAMFFIDAWRSHKQRQRARQIDEKLIRKLRDPNVRVLHG